MASVEVAGVHSPEIQPRYFPKARVVVLPESGHWPFLDDPIGFAAVVVPLLRQQLASG